MSIGVPCLVLPAHSCTEGVVTVHNDDASVCPDHVASKPWGWDLRGVGRNRTYARGALAPALPLSYNPLVGGLPRPVLCNALVVQDDVLEDLQPLLQVTDPLLEYVRLPLLWSCVAKVSLQEDLLRWRTK